MAHGRLYWSQVEEILIIAHSSEAATHQCKTHLGKRNSRVSLAPATSSISVIPRTWPSSNGSSRRSRPTLSSGWLNRSVVVLERAIRRALRSGVSQAALNETAIRFTNPFMQKNKTKSNSGLKGSNVRWADRNKYLAFFKSKMNAAAFKKISDCRTKVLKEMYNAYTQ